MAEAVDYKLDTGRFYEGRTFAEYLETQRTEVDAALEAFLPSAAQCPAVVAEAMRYSVMAGGKRLRPLLVLASAEAGAARSSCWGRS